MHFVDGITGLLFPARCHGCRSPIEYDRTPRLCTSCFSRLSPLISPLCSCCGTPFPCGEDHLCGKCLKKTFAFTRARSLFAYTEPLRSMLVRFKFGGDLAMLETLAYLAIQESVEDVGRRADCILPVPLHLNRLRSRGFNQALLLARHCFPGMLDKVFCDVLVRHQSTRPQTALSGKARRKNLRGAFHVMDRERICNQNIVLVDDVLTTGSTVDECARTLLDHGACSVEAVTLARVLAGRLTGGAEGQY